VSEFLFRDPDDEMAVAREQVAAACDNPEYQAYILKEGPLFLDELGGASEELATVIARYGWPDEIDGVIKAPPRYETDVEFMRGLKKQLGNGPSLSNHPFLHMLGAPLIDSYEEVARLGLRGIDLNGATPSLHRAHAVAPDLIDGARVIVNKMMSRYSHYKILPSEEFIERMRSPELSHDEDPLLDGYLTPGNEDICRALHMSYQLMARLLKVDDFSRIDQSDDFKGRHIDATSALRGLE
jgi:hypothetical protein